MPRLLGEFPDLPPMAEDRVVQWRPRDEVQGDDHFSDLDTFEPDPKGLRLADGYDIALLVLEIPQSYQEAIEFPDAAK